MTLKQTRSMMDVMIVRKKVRLNSVKLLISSDMRWSGLSTSLVVVVVVVVVVVSLLGYADFTAAASFALATTHDVDDDRLSSM